MAGWKVPISSAITGEWFQLQAPGKDPDLTGIGWNDHAAGVYKLDERLHPTAWTGQTACELIRNYDNDKPLFLKVSFARPHSPYDPPLRYLDMYKDTDIPKPHIGDGADNTPSQKILSKEHRMPHSVISGMRMP